MQVLSHTIPVIIVELKTDENGSRIREVSFLSKKKQDCIRFDLRFEDRFKPFQTISVSTTSSLIPPAMHETTMKPSLKIVEP